MSQNIIWKLYSFFVSLLPLGLKIKILPPSPPLLCIPIYRMKAEDGRNIYESWHTKWTNSGRCANALHKKYPDDENAKKYKWKIDYMQKSLGL